MEIHFVPVGIEANSKEEAEQKILKLQQIAATYKPSAKQHSQVTNSLASDLVGLALVAGYVLLGTCKKPECQAKGSKSFAKFQRDARIKLKKKEQKDVSSP